MPTFEALPMEICSHICAYAENNRTTIEALSLTSRSCHAIAMPYLLRRIHLDVPVLTGETVFDCSVNLAPALGQWNKLLNRHQAYKYVNAAVVTS